MCAPPPHTHTPSSPLPSRFCGQDNLHGASAFCARLGYSGGFGSLYQTGVYKQRLSVDAWRVGRLAEFQDFLDGLAGGNLRFTDWHCFAQRNDLRSIGIRCDGHLPKGRVASCNEALPMAKEVAPPYDHQKCVEGDVMLISDGTLYGRTDIDEGRRLVGGAGTAYVLKDGHWGSICRNDFRDDKHGANLFCRKLGFEWGIPGTFKGKHDHLPPSINLGRCTESDTNLLNCTGGKNDVGYHVNACVKQKGRTPLVVTCSGVFHGTHASCADWEKIPHANMSMIPPIVDESISLRPKRCPAIKENFTARFPAAMMTCNATSVKKTSCSTLKAKDIYDRIAVRAIQMYDSLPATCDRHCCPQADFAACMVRLAGHDFMVRSRGWVWGASAR